MILIYLVTITALPFLLLRIKGQNIYHQIGNFTFLKFHLFEEKTTQLPYLEGTSWAILYKDQKKTTKCAISFILIIYKKFIFIKYGEYSFKLISKISKKNIKKLKKLIRRPQSHVFPVTKYGQVPFLIIWLKFPI